MTKSPWINAAAASGYIILLSTAIFTIPRRFQDVPDFFGPVIMLSLLTFSVAYMAMVFFYRPIQMYLDGAKREGATLFLRTLGAFAGITGTIIIAVTLAFVR